MCVGVGKMIARTLYFMHQNIFRSYYIFNNDAFFFRFSRTKLPLIFLQFKLF